MRDSGLDGDLGVRNSRGGETRDIIGTYVPYHAAYWEKSHGRVFTGVDVRRVLVWSILLDSS